VFIDIIKSLFLFIVLLLGKGEYFKGYWWRRGNEENDEGNNDEDSLLNKDIAISNKNDNSDNDGNATKIGKAKVKATKEEE
jgi:hypothetical protein